MTTRADERLTRGTRGSVDQSRPGYRPPQSLTDARISIVSGFSGLSVPSDIASRLDYVLPDLVHQINAELTEIRRNPSYIKDGSVTFDKIDTTSTDGGAEQILRYDTTTNQIIASSKATITVTGSETTLDLNAQIAYLQLTSSGTNFAGIRFNVAAGANQTFEIAAHDTAIIDRLWIRQVISGGSTYRHWEARTNVIYYGDQTNPPDHFFYGDLLHLSGAGTILHLVESTDDVAAQYRLKSESTNRRLVALDGSDNVESQVLLEDNGQIKLCGPTAADIRFAVLSGGEILIKDGITAPGTVSGYGQIYIDSSDGDLKIKFGDGTVKTIVTDT